MTALDLMSDRSLLATAKSDFDATADVSAAALARLTEKMPDSEPHAHLHGGCGCAYECLARHRCDQRVPGCRGRRLWRARPAGQARRACLEVFETGARYQMYHALAMGLAALAMRGAATSAAQAAAIFFLVGIVLFSGSLYVLALTGVRGYRHRHAFRRSRISGRLGLARLGRDKGFTMSTEKILVAGAGIAGLGVALALGDGGREVTVLDRDPPPPDASPEEAFNTWERRGATQLRHSHVFLGRLTTLIRDRYPKLLDELLEAGARIFAFEDALPPALKDAYVPAPGDDEMAILFSRRTTLELVMRRYAAQLPDVRFVSDAGVRGLLAHRDGQSLVVDGLAGRRAATRSRNCAPTSPSMRAAATRPFRTGCVRKGLK